MNVQSYRDLEVWQFAIALADNIYDLTTTFPKEEIYGLAQQMRRCAVSVASNIAEGSARSGTRELIQFLSIAHGSLAELETQLIIAHRRKFIAQEAYDKTLQMCTSIGKMLIRLQQSLQRKAA